MLDIVQLGLCALTLVVITTIYIGAHKPIRQRLRDLKQLLDEGAAVTFIIFLTAAFGDALTDTVSRILDAPQLQLVGLYFNIIETWLIGIWICCFVSSAILLVRKKQRFRPVSINFGELP